MLEKRIIPALLIQNGGLVKSVKFKDHKYVGDPINTVKIFNNKEADELFLIDIEASKQNRGPDFSLLESIATEAFMPMGYAGGVKTLDQMEMIFKLGYEKVGLNSVLLERPELAREAARAFGSQSVVAIIDVHKNLLGKRSVYHHVGGKALSLSPLEVALRYQELGVGEIVIQSVFKDGTYTGYDCELIQEISAKVTIPVIALGGASKREDLSEVLKAGADAVAAGSIFIYHGPHKAVLINYPKRNEIEQILEKGK